jgi:ribosome-associated translation inhibitor RaiA
VNNHQLPEIAIDVVTRHGPTGFEDDARSMVERAIAHAPGPVLYARVTLDRASNPAVARPAEAKVQLDVNGQAVHAHVTAVSSRESIDLLGAKLRRQLEDLAERRRAQRRRTPDSGSGQWRHGDLPTNRRDHFPRPVDEREVVRRRSFAVRRLTLGEAVDTLERLDHDWLLFTELRSGLDAIIQRSERGFHITFAAHDPPDIPTGGLRLQIEAAAPSLTEREAVRALDASGLPFIFFVEEGWGRAEVVYRRYDGHYGVNEIGDD